MPTARKPSRLYWDKNTLMITESSKLDAWIELYSRRMNKAGRLGIDSRGVTFNILDNNLSTLIADARKQAVHARLVEGVAMERKICTT